MTSSQPTSQAGVVTLGETMGLVVASDSGPWAVGAPARMSFGGAETNVAIGLSRLGHRATWIGRVGADPIGSMIVTALRGEGVDVSSVVVEPSVPTGLMVREHRTADRVRVGYYRRGMAGSLLSPGDIDDSVVSSARILHISGITPALSSSAREAVHRAVSVARAAGVKVSFDLNYRSALWSPEDAAREYAELLTSADIVFAGESEAGLVVDAALVASAPSADIVKRLADFGPSEVVLKLGADGALALADGAVAQVPAVPVSMVDPVGAGDAFVAGYLAALLDGADLDVRLRQGNLLGAFTVSVAGDWEGLPRRDELALLDGTHGGENVAR